MQLDPSYQYFLVPEVAYGRLTLVRRKRDWSGPVEYFAGGYPTWQEYDASALDEGVFELQLWARTT